MDAPSAAARAVFLSYAREDAETARRIADALRAFGVEVWFDQNELRGGDSWDQKIRGQIRSCALFIPIISATTQARPEGYFRREWRFAVDRMQDMASGMAFIVPVCIDDTTESAALVPDEFMRFQWTRLPRGVPSPAFVEQVKRLLERGVGPVSDRPSGRTNAEAGQRPVLPQNKSQLALWISLGVAIAAVGAVFVVTRRKDKDVLAIPLTVPAATPDPKSQTPNPAAPAPRIADKSIAVLPFANMSEDKETSAFFADGIHEDILTNLALIRELRVVSRTTVQGYRGTAKPMKQIAQELGVTYILEGSVRRVGNKVRITGQLIHAATDEHVWAQTYDRDLTDIFALQSELSQQIAGALKAALSPEEKILIARKPTKNPAAYDLFLRARDLLNREGNGEGVRVRQIALLEKAVELDPEFAPAWGELAAACAYWQFAGYPGGQARLDRAKVAIDTATGLAPDDPEVIDSLGTYYYYGFRDYTRAAGQYERLSRLQPNSAVVFNSLGLIQRRQGQWARSLENSRRASELDPANLSYLRNLEATLRAGRRWEDYRAVKRRIIDLMPEDLGERFDLAYTDFTATGSTRETEAFLGRMSPTERESGMGIEIRRQWASSMGNYGEAIRLDRQQPFFEDSGISRMDQACLRLLDYLAAGDTEGARVRAKDFLAELRAELEREPLNRRLWRGLAFMELASGNREEALRCIDRAVELLPESRDALDGANMSVWRATIYDTAGEKEKALAEYTRMLRTPNVVCLNVHELRAGHSSLHGDPRFEALLNDAKNNAPLF